MILFGPSGIEDSALVVIGHLMARGGTVIISQIAVHLPGGLRYDDDIAADQSGGSGAINHRPIPAGFFGICRDLARTETTGIEKRENLEQWQSGRLLPP